MSLPQISFPAFCGCSLKWLFRSSKYLSMAALNDRACHVSKNYVAHGESRRVDYWAVAGVFFNTFVQPFGDVARK
jgi:hypothetical protein